MRQEKLFEKYLKLEAVAALSALVPRDQTELEVLRMSFASLASPQIIRSRNRDLNETLVSLETYAKAVAKPPFRGDVGVGKSKAMPVRYGHKGLIAASADQLSETLKSAYIDLLLAFIEARTLKKIRLLEKSLLVDSCEMKERTDQALRGKYPEFYRLAGRKTVFKKLESILREVAEIDLENLSPDTSLASYLGIDSLDLLDLIYKLEGAFSIKIEDKEFCGIDMTVGTLATILSKKLKL
jgi:acyl carrier protein